MDIAINSMDTRLLDLMKVAKERDVVGTVVNIFDKVINIEISHPASLLTVACSQVIQAPYMLKIMNQNTFNYLKQTSNIGDIVRFKNGGEMSLNNSRLHTHSAVLWDSKMPKKIASEQGLSYLKEEIDNYLSHEGTSGGILNAFLSQSSKNIEKPLFLTIYDKYFDRLIKQLSEDFTGDNMKKFIGLGVGLTPSGDDFIVGLLAALRSCEVGRGDEEKLKKELTKESIANKITRVSTHMINYALDGEFNEALLNLMSGVHPISTSLSQVNSIGSTSGTDMLAGISFALEHLLKEIRRRE